MLKTFEVSHAEDYTDTVYYDKTKQTELFNLVLDWLNENLEQPTFYTAGKLLETIDVTERKLCKSFNIDL